MTTADGIEITDPQAWVWTVGRDTEGRPDYVGQSKLASFPEREWGNVFATREAAVESLAERQAMWDAVWVPTPKPAAPPCEVSPAEVEDYMRCLYPHLATE